MSYKLYLDDIRQPPDSEWVVVRDYDEFVHVIQTQGIPDLVSFDHDLAMIHYGGGVESFSYHEKTGDDCAKFLLEECRRKKVEPPAYKVHSMNPVGAQNIINTMRHG